MTFDPDSFEAQVLQRLTAVETSLTDLKKEIESRMASKNNLICNVALFLGVIAALVQGYLK